MSSAAQPAPDRLVFGPFEMDLVAGCLRRDGILVPVRPKAWGLLLHLASRPGSLVPASELLDAVWGVTAITPNALSNVVGELRRALQDEGSSPLYLETVRGRGYRFLAEVHPAVAPSGARRDGASAGRPATAGFVGRGPEMELLDTAARHAATGRRQVVFVSGEPGIGKSSLVECFAAGHPTASCIVSRCAEGFGAAEAWAPFLSILDTLLASPRQETTLAALRSLAPTWLLQVPGLLDGAEAAALARPLLGAGADRMLREGAALFEELARVEPLTLVIEDLHQADASTLSLVAALVERDAPSRLLLLLTLRPLEAFASGSPLTRLRDESDPTVGVRWIALRGLETADVRRCLARGFRDDDLAARLAGPVERHSGGNPLFIKVIARQLREDGWVRRGPRGWETDADIALFLPRLPEDLREVVELQVAALPEDCQRVLEAAGVAGVEITAPLVAEALEWTTAHVEDLLHAVAHETPWLVPSAPVRSDRTAPPEDAWAFSHAIYRGVVHARIPPSRRRLLHARVAAAVERRHAADTSPVAARLAAHFEATADFERAALYREKTAHLAFGRFAYAEAATELETALALLSRIAVEQAKGHAHDGMPATGNGEPLEARRSRLLLALGNTRLAHLGYVESAIEAFGAARDAAETVGDRRTMARATCGVLSTLCGAGRLREAVAAIETPVQVTGDGPIAQYTWMRIANVYVMAGKLREAEKALDRAAAVEPEPGVPMLLDARAEEESVRALVVTLAGRPQEGLEIGDRSVLKAEGAGLPWGLSTTLVMVLEASLLAEDATRSARYAEAFLANATRHALSRQVPIAAFLHCCATADPRPRLTLLREARRLLAVQCELGDDWHQPIHFFYMAALEFRSGNLDEASARCDAAFARIDAGGEPVIEPELWRMRARIGLARGGSREEAGAHLERAVAIAAEGGSRLFEERARREQQRLAAC